MNNIDELERYSPQHYTYDTADQLRQHVYTRSTKAFHHGNAQRDLIQNPNDLLRHQQKLRDFFVRCLGGLPESGSLHPKNHGMIKADGYTIDKVTFESRPGDRVTANLYLPQGLSGPTGAVQFLCGHHRSAKHHPEYQTVCQTLVRAGLVVLAQDPIGQGERLTMISPDLSEQDTPWGVAEHDSLGLRCRALGQTLGRYFLHDAMRGIDYLLTRPEVDPQRIGVTGNSGGGTQTSMMMMTDPRIAAAAPATFIMNRESYLWSGQAQDAEQIWPGFTSAGYDHEDILLAVCPKPVRVLAVTWDFFPIEGTRQTVERCQRFWEAADQASALDLVEDQARHAYTPRLAESAAEFFAKHLIGLEVKADAGAASPLPESDLWCSTSGQLLFDDPSAPTVHTLLASIASDRSLDFNGNMTANWLEPKVFANRTPCELNPRQDLDGRWDGMAYESWWWWSQPGLINHALLFKPVCADDSAVQAPCPISIALWPGGTNSLTQNFDLIERQINIGHAVMVLDVTGSGAIAPRPLDARPFDAFYGVVHKLDCDLSFLADSLVALRTYDVCRALDFIAQRAELSKSPIQMIGGGYPAIPAVLAAAIDPRITKITLSGELPCYRSLALTKRYDERGKVGAVIPDALSHFDLDGLISWVNTGRPGDTAAV